MEQILVATITAVPPLTGVAWAMFRELKKISRSVNGELEDKFTKLHGCIDELGSELADVKADVRDVRADMRSMKDDVRDHRFTHEGDGR